MTRIILVLDEEENDDELEDIEDEENDEQEPEYIYEDPRSHRELVKLINTGQLIIGEELFEGKKVRQWAMSHYPTNTITVVNQPPPVLLTPRHYDVLYGLSDDLRAAEIAKELGISRRTVYLYISELKEKFGARTRMHLIAQAYRANILTEEGVYLLYLAMFECMDEDEVENDCEN